MTEGVAKAQALLSENRIPEAVEMAQTLTRENPGDPAGWAYGYGYQWWIRRLEVDGEIWDIPTAVGNGNQRILIVEPLKLVLVVTAGHYNQSQGVCGVIKC
jgi:CubicO group peptidase (beta-lactamase class C family)